MLQQEMDKLLKDTFSAAQVEVLKKLRIDSVFQLCALAGSSKEAADLLASMLQMSYEDLEKHISRFLKSFSKADQKRLEEFHPIEKGMGLRKRDKDSLK
jgi:hypothetical protein